jgi:hypothetical protein
LNFHQDDTATGTVNGPRWQVQTISQLGNEMIQALIDSAVVQTAFKLRLIDALLQPRIQSSLTRGLQNDPRLTLAGVFHPELLRLVIAGMNLNGERLLTIQQLDQQRETVRALVIGSRKITSMLIPQLRQQAPFEGAVCHTADMQWMTTEFPRLSDGAFPRGKKLTEMGQPVPSPDLGTQERLEDQRLHETNAFLARRWP